MLTLSKHKQTIRFDTLSKLQRWKISQTNRKLFTQTVRQSDRQTDRQTDRYPAASCGPVYVDSADWFHTEECETLNGRTGFHPETLYAHESSAHTHRRRERVSKEFAHFFCSFSDTSQYPARINILFNMVFLQKVFFKSFAKVLEAQLLFLSHWEMLDLSIIDLLPHPPPLTIESAIHTKMANGGVEEISERFSHTSSDQIRSLLCNKKTDILESNFYLFLRLLAC